MSVAGIGSSSFFDAGVTKGVQDKNLQFQKELQQLNQDLQSGNADGVQQDLTKLQQDSRLQTLGARAHHLHRGGDAGGAIRPIIDHFDPAAHAIGLAAVQQAYGTLQAGLQQFARSGGHQGQPDIGALLAGVSVSA